MMQELAGGLEPFRELTRSMFGETGFVPTFEVKETPDSFIFKADLPGIKEDNLNISLSGNRLTVSGERQQEKKDENERYYAYERSYGNFSRSFTLPDGVDAEHVQADLKDGVLTIAVPKKPEVQPKKIPLRVTPGGEGQATKEKAKA
jgi:HSP20 family protein